MSGFALPRTVVLVRLAYCLLALDGAACAVVLHDRLAAAAASTSALEVTSTPLPLFREGPGLQPSAGPTINWGGQHR